MLHPPPITIISKRCQTTSININIFPYNSIRTNTIHVYTFIKQCFIIFKINTLLSYRNRISNIRLLCIHICIYINNNHHNWCRRH